MEHVNLVDCTRKRACDSQHKAVLEEADQDMLVRLFSQETLLVS